MRKRILILNTTFRYEGPNDVLFQLTRHVDPLKFEIVLACMHEGGPMEKIYEDAGYQVHNFKMERFIDLGAVLRVRDFVRSEKIDLVMAQLLRSEVFGGFGAWLAGIPLVLVVQNIDPYRANPWFFPHYYLSRLSMRWPVKIVAASEYVRQFVIKHQGLTNERIVTIHDAIDPEQFVGLIGEKENVRKEFGLHDKIVIGCVARYDQQKGLFYLLEAFRMLTVRYENIRLVLVGDGPQRKELEEWVKKENMEGKIILAGFRRDYDRIMQGFDIFVLPSLWEGLPLALMSAMVSGKAVVSTIVSGIPEIIEDGVNGFLVPPANEAALSEKIEKLICVPRLREETGLRAREYIENNLSAAVMAKKYEALWEECLS